MIRDVFVVDASAHSYNLAEENYAAGWCSLGVVDAFYGAHYGLSPIGYRLPCEQFVRDWTLAETANMLERVLAGVPGVHAVKCTFDHGANWRPDDMTAGARRKLEVQREFVRIRAGA